MGFLETIFEICCIMMDDVNDVAVGRIVNLSNKGRILTLKGGKVQSEIIQHIQNYSDTFCTQ